MNPARPLVVLALLLAIPAATAATGATCSLDNQDLCDVAESAFLVEIFGEYGDIALIGIGLVAVTLVLILVLSLVFRLRPTRLLSLDVAEKMKEAEPGGNARFKLDLENQHPRLPVDVFLEHESLPDGWSHEVNASVVLPSGFRSPQALGSNGSFTLSSETRGAHQALIDVRLHPPADMDREETLDYEFRAVPYFKGRIRKGKARRARLSVLVTPHLPKVQIARVTHEPERIVVGAPVRTRAFLANKGERDAANVAVRFLLNDEEMDTKILPSLGINAEAEVEFNWTPHAGENKIRVAIGS